MANTGYQRSLTIEVNKTVAGVQSGGYPRTYNGKNEFTYNGTSYPAIDTLLLATMPIEDYQSRLYAFKAYVEALEPGLDIDAAMVAGKDAYRENLGACPL
jgi:hypothetical protein